MKKFTFPFQRAMEWREKRAEQEKSELERLHGVRQQLQKSREDVRTEMNSVRRQPEQMAATTSDALHQMAAFSQSLQALETRLKTEESRCTDQIESQKKKCIAADRDYRLLSQLHDNRRRQWDYESAREIEQVAADSWNAGYSRQIGRDSEVPE